MRNYVQPEDKLCKPNANQEHSLNYLHLRISPNKQKGQYLLHMPSNKLINRRKIASTAVAIATIK